MAMVFMYNSKLFYRVDLNLELYKANNYLIFILTIKDNVWLASGEIKGVAQFTILSKHFHGFRSKKD